MSSSIATSLCAHRQEVAGVWDQLWSRQPSPALDDALLDRERAFKRWRLIEERIHQTFGQSHGLRAVELGCGRGDLSVLLAQQGVSVTLLDSSPHGLSQARQRFARLGLSADFRQADLFEPDETPGQFDLVLSSGVIEHFVGDQRSDAIRAHADRVRSGGLVIISVPNAHCGPYRIWKKWLELRGRWPYGYETPYSRFELSRRSRGLGFGRIEIAGCGFLQSWRDQLRPLLTGPKPLRLPVPDSLLDHWFGLALVMFAWKF